MSDNFTPSDSDLVFRRKERWILAAVVGVETILFVVLFFTVILNGKQQDVPIVGGVFLANILLLGGFAYWMWTYEVRVTPYELVIRSLLGVKVIPFSMISGLERVKIQGKAPEQFQLKIRTSDDQKLALPDAREGIYSLHEELKARCKALARMEEKILEP